MTRSQGPDHDALAEGKKGLGIHENEPLVAGVPSDPTLELAKSYWG